jgi:imidazole glycerol-phosphate synthase subunit HisH
MIGIVDYGLGNLASVRNAFDHLGFNARICDVPESAAEFERIVLPGVGSFRAAMQRLGASGWVSALGEFARDGRPLLGICLGMQLLFDRGDEHGSSDGLGLIPGDVVRLDPAPPNRVPHVGWNSLDRIVPHPLFRGVKPKVDFYFVHSYHCRPAHSEDVLATCDFGGDFVAAVARANVAGMQFHPEKSQPSGMLILNNFAQWEPVCLRSG